MLYRVYKHKCQFKHNVSDAPWLEDRGCLKPHEHGFDPNPPCIIEFIVATKEIIDFKKVKEYAIDIIENKFANEILIKGEEDIEGRTIQLPYYDFGTLTTEEMLRDLKKLMWIELDKGGYGPIRIQIWLDETRKYSVWDDGDDSEGQIKRP